MKPEIKEKWLKALRGEDEVKYEQGKGYLKRDGDHYCCLGVLCDLYRREFGINEWHERPGDYAIYIDSASVLPERVRDWAELPSCDPLVHNGMTMDRLSALNDAGANFAEIADLIEKSL